jgi:hypothetical protein
MPSPFPGVDPFIEDQGLWQDFHHTFINYWREAIAAVLPDDYVVRIDERFEIVETLQPVARHRLPDIAIVQTEDEAASPKPWSSPPSGLRVVEPVRIPQLVEDAQRESYLEILRLPDRKLVTILELLSPTNKTGRGRLSYLTKRNEILLNGIHLVELDLLLGGERLVMLEEPPASEYYAYISRAGCDSACEVYPLRLNLPLPSLPIPLLAKDGDVWIDVQQVLETAFQRGRYDKELDYTRPLSLPLADELRVWAQRLGAGA